MTTPTDSAPISKGALWTGYIMSALPVLMLVMSAVTKFLKPKPVVDGFNQMGWSLDLATPLGIVELVCTVLYLIPRTSVLGAILITGYLGGATAATLRSGQSFIPPVVLGILVWGGLFMRDRRIRAMIPVKM